MFPPVITHRSAAALRDGSHPSKRGTVKLLKDYPLETLLRLRLGVCADEKGAVDEGVEGCTCTCTKCGSNDGLTPVPLELLLAAHRSRPKVRRPESVPDDCLSLVGKTGRNRNIVKCRRKAAMQFLAMHTCKLIQKNIVQGTLVLRDSMPVSGSDNPTDSVESRGSKSCLIESRKHLSDVNKPQPDVVPEEPLPEDVAEDIIAEEGIAEVDTPHTPFSTSSYYERSNHDD